MAIQQLPSSPMRAVTVWVPNEVEGQILGGTPSHVDATHDSCLPLIAHSAREGLGWLVRQEGELRYLRATYTRLRDRVGTLYPDCLVAVGLPPIGDIPYDLTVPTMPAPLLIVEVISKKTRARDVGPKVQVYAQLGVREYVTFDPAHGRSRSCAATGWRHWDNMCRFRRTTMAGSSWRAWTYGW